MLEQYKALVREGTVVQIMPEYDSDGTRSGLVGAFLYVTEVKPWGVQGFIHHVETFTEHGFMYFRPKWEDIEYIGQSPLTTKAPAYGEDGGSNEH